MHALLDIVHVALRQAALAVPARLHDQRAVGAVDVVQAELPLVDDGVGFRVRVLGSGF